VSATDTVTNGGEMSERGEVADGMRIDWDVPIRMEDGLVLRADVYRPIEADKYPVILSYGPYAKGLAFQEGYPQQWRRMADQHPDVTAGSTNKYQNWEVVDPEKWVPDGYACVRVDARGAGNSPGYLDCWSAREAKDLYNCIEWAAEQPWSNGKVGLDGISYYAMNEWQVAALQPPHLAAICPWEGASDWYREVHRHGGILCDFAGNWYPRQVESVQYGRGSRASKSPISGESVAGPVDLSDEELARNRADMPAEALAHPLDDEYYRSRTPDFSKITVPLLSAANWGGQGLHPRGNFEGYSRSSSPQKWLEVHGLEHWTHFYTDYGRTLQKRFFDHFLKGLDNDWRDQPPVRLQVRHVDRFVQRAENEWPLARTEWTKLYLSPADAKLSWRPVEEAGAVEYEALGDGVTFMTSPLVHDTEITGPVAAKLFISSSTSDADLFLVLRVFDPDGEEVVFQGALDPHTPIGQGWLRASHRKLDPELSTEYRPYHPHDEARPLTPGEVYELDLEIWPTCIVVPTGYRIALTVRGKDYEYQGKDTADAANPYPSRGCGPFTHTNPQDRPSEVFGGKVTVHAGGEKGSYLLLPIIPG
jgi:predicted acyl esterase